MGEKEGKDIKTVTEAWRLIFWHGFNALNLNKIYEDLLNQWTI